jgi:hypothetical protein
MSDMKGPMAQEKEEEQELEKEIVESVKADLGQKMSVRVVSILKGNNHRTSAEVAAQILADMNEFSDEFETRVGRPPTYSELRDMFG